MTDFELLFFAFQSASSDSLSHPYLTMALIALVGTLLGFALIWYLQYRLKDAGVVDVFWPLSIGAMGLFYCVVSYGLFTRRAIVAVLISAWAFRLSYYLFERWQTSPEDKRYAALKEKWGNQAQTRMFRFYQIQGIAAFLFSIPILFAASSVRDFGVLDVIGLVIWMIAMFGEAIADSQLYRFKLNPENKGEVCKEGLWKYSRHPNYFFEWLHWCAYIFFCIALPWGWVSILAPIAMWYVLTNVTGIPHAEAQAIESRGDKYRDYQRTTSPFFPWFPKSA